MMTYNALLMMMMTIGVIFIYYPSLKKVVLALYKLPSASCLYTILCTLNKKPNSFISVFLQWADSIQLSWKRAYSMGKLGGLFKDVLLMGWVRMVSKYLVLISLNDPAQNP